MDSQDPSQLFFFVESSSNFHFLPSQIDFTDQNHEESPIKQNHDVNEQRDNDSQKSRKRNRVDNNIFKTPLSEFRKVMKHFFAQKKMQSEVFVQINKEKRNYSTFPKYWLLSEKMGIKEQLKELFRQKMDEILEKKKQKVSKKRYEELERVYSKMMRSLECTEIEEAVREYWGRYRQKSKFVESWEEIRRFQNFLETMN